jgi:hypothetical protein
MAEGPNLNYVTLLLHSRTWSHMLLKARQRMHPRKCLMSNHLLLMNTLSQALLPAAHNSNQQCLRFEKADQAHSKSIPAALTHCMFRLAQPGSELCKLDRTSCCCCCCYCCYCCHWPSTQSSSGC